MSWKTQDTAPEQALADQQPDEIRVTLADGSQVLLEQPAVLGDTLTGICEGQPVSIALGSVSHLEVREVDTFKVVGGTVGTVALVALIALTAAAESMYW
jgi:hypothetical protein